MFGGHKWWFICCSELVKAQVLGADTFYAQIHTPVLTSCEPRPYVFPLKKGENVSNYLF